MKSGGGASRCTIQKMHEENSCYAFAESTSFTKFLNPNLYTYKLIFTLNTKHLNIAIIHYSTIVYKTKRFYLSGFF